MTARLALGGGVLAIAMMLAGCASGPRGGRDGAPSNSPPDLSSIPDALPRIEAIPSSGGTSKPYTVLGRAYTPISDDRPFRETGLASWYGGKFDRQITASGERYDMYAMTAAHKTLPLPSYLRVRNPANGREVIVRVNDRGPFRDDRVIDLSYAAALKLNLLRGVAPVEIERITNEDIRTGAWRRQSEGTALAAASVVAPNSQQSVSVPTAFTTPVVATPRTTVADLPPMAPLMPLGPPGTAATPTPSSSSSSSSVSVSVSAPEATPEMATSGYWVQLGAFSQRDGAIAFQQKIAASMPSLAASVNVFSESGTHRVQVGPYASRDSALVAAEQVHNGLQLVPIVVERR
jgi:rare lipoprotein A